MFCGRESSKDGMRVRRNVFLCAVIAYVAWMFLAGVQSWWGAA